MSAPYQRVLWYVALTKGRHPFSFLRMAVVYAHSAIIARLKTDPVLLFKLSLLNGLLLPLVVRVACSGEVSFFSGLRDVTGLIQWGTQVHIMGPGD